MDLIPILRALLDHRRWLVVGAVLGLLAATVALYRVDLGVPPTLESRQYHVGVASLDVLVDTPTSRVADLLPPTGTENLGERATLLAGVLGTAPVQADVARRAGIPVGDLTTVPPGLAPLQPTQLAKHAGALPAAATPYRLTLTLQHELSILGMSVEGPDARSAGRVANAAVQALVAYVVAAGERQGLPPRFRPAITPLGDPVAIDMLRGPTRATAVIVAIVVFGGSCSLLVVLAGLAGRWRRSAPVHSRPIALSNSRRL